MSEVDVASGTYTRQHATTSSIGESYLLTACSRPLRFRYRRLPHFVHLSPCRSLRSLTGSCFPYTVGHCPLSHMSHAYSSGFWIHKTPSIMCFDLQTPPFKASMQYQMINHGCWHATIVNWTVRFHYDGHTLERHYHPQAETRRLLSAYTCH